MKKRTFIIGAGVAAGVAAAAAAMQRRQHNKEDVTGEPRSQKVFEYAKVDGAFLEVAPVKGTTTRSMPASAATMFRVLEDDQAWPQWLDALNKVEWTSELGPTATRKIWMGKMVIDETYFEWETDKVMAFRFERGPLPVIEAFAERWQLEPISDKECNLTWEYGLQARGPLKAAHSLIAKGIPLANAKWLDQLAEFVTTHAEDYQATT